jgi:hypothetical protein
MGQYRFPGVGTTSLPGGGEGLLRWSPPTQTSPTAISVPTTGLSRTLGTSEDAILTFPSSPVTGQVGITGGRHIRIIGGKMVETRTTTSQKYQILVRECRGSVFLEGLDLDASTSRDTDNIVVSGYAPRGVNRVGWSTRASSSRPSRSRRTPPRKHGSKGCRPACGWTRSTSAP